MRNIFTKETTDHLIERIENLNVDTLPIWGRMNASAMLAHCCVTYEMVYSNKHPKPNFFTKLMLKLFVKKLVVSEKPYTKNTRTAPQFLITNNRNFSEEKSRLISFIKQTQELGKDHFEGKESHSLGALTAQEWNNMFYKHLNHHLQQFGV